jgi:hypothetical protein
VNTDFANSTEMDNSKNAHVNVAQEAQEDSELTFKTLQHKLENEMSIIAQMGGNCGCSSYNNVPQRGGDNENFDSEDSNENSDSEDSNKNSDSDDEKIDSDDEKIDSDDEKIDSDDEKIDSDDESDDFKKNKKSDSDNEDEDDIKEDSVEFSLTATSVSSINLVPFYSTPNSSFNNNVHRRNRFN